MYKFKTILPLIFLPNLFWYGFSILFKLDRPFINIDYFLIFFFLSCPKLALIIFFILNFFDFLLLFSQIFTFIRIPDLLYLLKFIFLSSYLNLILILIFAIYLCIFYFFVKKNKTDYNLLIVMIFLNFFLFVMSAQDYLNAKMNWVTSQSYEFYKSRNMGFLENFNEKSDGLGKVQIQSASHDLFNEPIKYNKILLIVNESWGEVDEKIQKDVLSPLYLGKKIKSFEYRNLSFSGFTLAAEIRELCQKSINHFNMKDQYLGFEVCLPNKLKKLGYETIAFHGATSFMYDRRYWYPRAGFVESYFKDNLLHIKSRCYSFPGMCDKDLIQPIREKIKKGKIFVYWLTLNSHINYDLRDLKVDLFDCEKFGVNRNSTTCRNLKLQKQFFYYLATLVQDPELKGAYVVVVGDHKPPIYGDEKDVFVQDVVPVLRMILN